MIRLVLKVIRTREYVLRMNKEIWKNNNIACKYIPLSLDLPESSISIAKSKRPHVSDRKNKPR
jgi:hypothetical protein